MSQNCGLTTQGKEFIKKSCIHDKIETYRNGELIDIHSEPRKVIYKESKPDEFGDYSFADPDLLEYLTKDGKKIREIIQVAPWLSGPNYFLCLDGPNYFLCLEDEEGNRIFEWNEEEIENYI